MARDARILGLVTDLVETAGWKALREEALAKLASNEETVNKLIFRTRTQVDPIEIEYFRGFRQGVIYVLDGLPNGMRSEFERLIKESGI